MNERCASVAQAALSLILAASGFTKIALPASSAVLGSLEVPEVGMQIVGCWEVCLAAAAFAARWRRSVAVIGLMLGLAGAIMMRLHWIDVESCGCFGRMEISHAQHELLSAVLVIASSLVLMVEPDGVDE